MRNIKFNIPHWLNYRIQGKFSRYIRWGGSVVPTNEPPSRRATKLYNLD